MGVPERIFRITVLKSPNAGNVSCICSTGIIRVEINSISKEDETESIHNGSCDHGTCRLCAQPATADLYTVRGVSYGRQPGGEPAGPARKSIIYQPPAVGRVERCSNGVVGEWACGL